MKPILGQSALPAEFRIAVPPVRWVTEFVRDQEVPDTGAPASSSDIVETRIDSESMIEPSTLADLCTGLWRLRRRMTDAETGRPREEMRQPYRHLMSAWDALSAAGIEIKDHKDDSIPEYGSVALEVLAYQPTPGITRDRVIDTVKPSVYAQGRLVQMGQVIVGTPEKTDGSIGEGTAS